MIELPYPPTGNTYFRFLVIKDKPRIVRSKAANQYLAKVNDLFLALGEKPKEGLIGIRIHLYRPYQRGDLDNHIKVVLDALQGHLYVNDSQIREINAIMYEDKFNPRVEVEVFHWARQGIGFAKQGEQHGTDL